MAAPYKEGLDYFPLYVDDDENLEYVEAKHGIVGFGIYVKLLKRIYKHGYFISWEDRDIAIFAKKNNLDINVVINVVNDCIMESCFNKMLYNEYKILTSCFIQHQYIKCCERRKRISLIEEYLCIDLNIDFPEIENVYIYSINDSINPQNKKKIKRNRKRNKKETSEPIGSDNFSDETKSKLLEDAKRLALDFEQRFKENKPQIIQRMSNYLDRWIDSYEKLLRIDERPFNEILMLNEWVFEIDKSWWAKTNNFLSPCKFRERNKDKIYYYDILLEERKKYYSEVNERHKAIPRAIMTGDPRPEGARTFEPESQSRSP